MKQIEVCLNRFFNEQSPLKSAKWKAYREATSPRLLLFHYHHLVLVYNLETQEREYEWWEVPADKRGLEAAKSYLANHEIVSGFYPDYIVPPGETLKECMEMAKISSKAMAERISLSEESLLQVLQGAQPITESLADSFEQIIGIPKNFWLNLERIYQENKMRNRGKACLED